MLRKDRHPNLDFFLADFRHWTPKDDQASMENPFFSLSKNPDYAIRRYEHNGSMVEITPSVKGLATIWDADVLLYCASQLIAGIKEGRSPRQVIRFQAFDFLVSTNRSTSSRGYALLEQGLDRLMGVTVKTNLKTGQREETDSFHLIERWRAVKEEANSTVEVELPTWFYRAVTHFEVLTIHRDYFRLDGGLERRVYELCRKHCGHQDKWIVGLSLLQKKSGARSPAKKFRYYIKRLATLNHLPEYRLRFDAGADKLIVYPRSRKGGLQEFKDVIGLT